MFEFLNNKKNKKIFIDFLLTIFFGWLGVHKFKNKQYGLGVFYLLTFGIFYIGWIIDSIKSMVQIRNCYNLEMRKKKLNAGILDKNKIDLLSALEMGDFYELTSSSGKCIVYSNYLEIWKKDSKECITVKFDESNMEEFNFEKARYESKGVYNALYIHYFKNKDLFYSCLEVYMFDKKDVYNIENLVNYLKEKSKFKVEYDNLKKIEKEKIENERKYGKKRYSNVQFAFINEDMYLKYKYYNVEIKGTQYMDFDVSKIAIDEELNFQLDPSNKYDKNAIKVIYNNIEIGYVPKNNLQDMVKNYLDSDDRFITAFVSRVNEDARTIDMAIGFYKKLDDEELDSILHIDVRLIKTTKKDEYDSRQDNLTTLSIGDEVEIDYSFETETYIVSNLCGELGEINKSKSQQLKEYENDGKSFFSSIIDLNDEGDNITCKVRVFILEE